MRSPEPVEEVEKGTRDFKWRVGDQAKSVPSWTELDASIANRLSGMHHIGVVAEIDRACVAKYGGT